MLYRKMTGKRDMKYKAIIADEWMIIQLIRQLGHWEELDIEIVDECQTGEDALQSILKKFFTWYHSDMENNEPGKRRKIK